MDLQTVVALFDTKRYSRSKILRVCRSNAPEKSKIPLQNNGTLAFYKNINLFKPGRKTYSQL